MIRPTKIEPSDNGKTERNVSDCRGEAVAQESAAKRDEALEAVYRAIYSKISGTFKGLTWSVAKELSEAAISAYERVMAEPDAPQPRKDGTEATNMNRSQEESQ